MDPKLENELAKRLAAAYISYTMGVTLNFAYRQVQDREGVGDYWVRLAEMVVADHAGAYDA